MDFDRLGSVLYIINLYIILFMYCRIRYRMCIYIMTVICADTLSRYLSDFLGT